MFLPKSRMVSRRQIRVLQHLIEISELASFLRYVGHSLRYPRIVSVCHHDASLFPTRIL
jgi:hypothetical protein